MKPKRCLDCALFCRRPDGGACCVNPIPRRGITPGCDSFIDRQTSLEVKPCPE